MKLNVAFSGQESRFEGNRSLLLKGLPVGIQVQQAQVTVTPVAASGGQLFEEVLTFVGNQEEFGGTKVPGVGFVEVDFHARRTLAAVAGPHLTGSLLLVDLGGGVFMEINEKGAIATPDNDNPYPLPASRILPGLTVNKFRLNEPTPPAATDALNVTQVTVRTVPTNVSVGLGQLAPVWTHVGEMSTAQTSSDFGDILQLFLAEAAVKDGYYEIPLVLHSDALTRLDVAVAITYLRQQSALPAGLNELSLPYAYDGTPQTAVSLIQVAVPIGAEVTTAVVQVVGSFNDSRIVVGPTGPVSPIAAIAPAAGSVTPQRSQAQPILLTTSVAATAVDLLLSSVSQIALLDLNLMADVDGKPFGEPLLPRPVPIELDRDLASSATWLSARLPQEFQFQANQRYWLVVQAREGEAIWHSVLAEAESAGLQNSTSGGLAWRVTKEAQGLPLAGLFRLRRTPAQFQMPLAVQVGEGDGAVLVSLDRFQPLGRVDFTIDFPEFAAAINQVAGHSAAAACPQGEQLQNGDFAQWATRGDKIGSVQEANATEAKTVTIAPSGEWLYVGLPDGTARFQQLPIHSAIATTSFAPASRRHVALRGDSQRAYVVAYINESHILQVVDTETFQPLGNGVDVNETVTCITLAPNGRRLYIAITKGVWVVDTAILEQLLNRGSPFSLTDALAIPDPISVHEGNP